MKNIVNQTVAKFGYEWFRFDQSGMSVAEASVHRCNFCVGAMAVSQLEWRGGNARLYRARDISFYWQHTLYAMFIGVLDRFFMPLEQRLPFFRLKQ